MFIWDFVADTAPQILFEQGRLLGDSAAGSLLAIKDLCRQMEWPVTTEQPVSGLQTSYRTYEDKGLAALPIRGYSAGTGGH